MRRKLPATRPFILPSWFAWIANIIGLVYIIVTTILFFFPPDLPVNANNMNYCIVAFGIWMFICAVWWFVSGKKNYTGPKVKIDGNVITSKEIAIEDPTDGEKPSRSGYKEDGELA